jgi:predicted nucleic acid-binding protein
LLERATSEGWSLVTTNAVVVETYSVLLARARDSRGAAIAFLDALEEDAAGGVAVERVRVSDEDRSKALVRSHEDKDYSLCDALSFVVMERLVASSS